MTDADPSKRARARRPVPVEVRAAALVALAGPALFLIVALVRWRVEGGAGLFGVPTAFAVAEFAVAGGLLAGLRPARATGMVVFVLAALVHLMILLGSTPWWARLVAAVLAAAHIYATVLLGAGPTRDYLGGAR
ncbi:hypothetical protein [Goodfellowiella coeruleoviolacea]|uniref:Uncharacterized protein n=1 Tax=Goodfellowiella coeruleoviolacea TaxID=334858 RepID=A0AAE3GDQ8_9PSEU|nr:hypothetical protein [Goodfellowiella coeruleoviolacea]MCP2166336.1 hypothetical protein [Goodfellowiella coeruleoviolacea]